MTFYHVALGGIEAMEMNHEGKFPALAGAQNQAPGCAVLGQNYIGVTLANGDFTGSVELPSPVASSQDPHQLSAGAMHPIPRENGTTRGGRKSLAIVDDH